MNETQIARLAAMANTLRPDWPNASIYTFIARELSARAYRDVAVALAWIACDQDTKTPKRLLEAGPWWKAVAGPDSATYRPPRKTEDCPHHPGNYAEGCRGCIADQLAGEKRPPAPAEPRRPDRSEHLQRVRAELDAARADLAAKRKPPTEPTPTPRRNPPSETEEHR